jgi:hypothetical protein
MPYRYDEDEPILEDSQATTMDGQLPADLHQKMMISAEGGISTQSDSNSGKDSDSSSSDSELSRSSDSEMEVLKPSATPMKTDADGGVTMKTPAVKVIHPKTQSALKVSLASSFYSLALLNLTVYFS